MKARLNIIVAGISLVSTLAVATNLFENEITQRQNAFTQIEKLTEDIEDELDSKNIDWKQLKEHSEKLVEASNSLPSLFPEGSHDGSRAKKSIWDKTSEFQSKLTQLNQSALTLNQNIDSENTLEIEHALAQATVTIP